MKWSNHPTEPCQQNEAWHIPPTVVRYLGAGGTVDFSVGYPGEEIGWVGWRLYKWMGEECYCCLVCCWGEITKSARMNEIHGKYGK